MPKNATQPIAGRQRHKPENTDVESKDPSITQNDNQYQTAENSKSAVLWLADQVGQLSPNDHRIDAIRKLFKAPVQNAFFATENTAEHADSSNESCSFDEVESLFGSLFDEDYLLELESLTKDPPASNHGNQEEAPVTVSPSPTPTVSHSINESNEDAPTVKRMKLMEQFVEESPEEVIKIFKGHKRRTGDKVLKWPPGTPYSSIKKKYKLRSGIQPEKRGTFITRLYNFPIHGETLGLRGDEKKIVRFEDPRDCGEVIGKLEEWFERKQQLTA